MKSATANTYRVTEVAALLGTSGQSLRTWSTEFRAYLSPGAAPTTGAERRYTATDVRLLVLVRDLKRERLPSPAIGQALQAALDDRSDQALPKFPDMPLNADVPVSIVTKAQNDWLKEQSHLESTIMRLEVDKRELQERLDRSETGRREDIERLLREIGGLQAEIARLKA